MDFNNLKFLSDDIYFDLGKHLTAEHVGNTLEYTIHVDFPDSEPVYRGNVYILNTEECKIRLNDIAVTQVDDFQWFRTKRTDNIKPDFIDLIVKVPSLQLVETISVFNMYATPGHKHNFTATYPAADGTRTDWANSYGQITIRYRSGVEHLAGPAVISNFMILDDHSEEPFILAKAYFVDNEANKVFTKYELRINYYHPNYVVNDYILLASGDIERTGRDIIQINHLLKGDDIKKAFLSHGGISSEWTDKLIRIYILSEDGQTKSAYAPADFLDTADLEPEFYLAWINRAGNFSMFPFCKNWEMKEDIKTSNITTVNNETIPYQKTNEYSWTLNTDWLDMNRFNTMEGLLASKYVYLYNSRTGQCDYVNIKDSNWTFKNTTNANKPFNLTVNVVKAQKQNIIY